MQLSHFLNNIGLIIFSVVQQMKCFRKFLNDLCLTFRQELKKMEKMNRKSQKIKVKFPGDCELTVHTLPNTSALPNDDTLSIAPMMDEELMIAERKCTVVCTIIQRMVLTINESLKSSP